ncbi:hypothetical protein LP421_13110 [Rhizobium sp. RCAM05350]|nr:hypothetical protein LP421_13110 [Rhizobium sp. RCAM05350]
MARIGQLLLDDGVINGERLVPEAAIKSIRGGGDKAVFEKAGYANLPGWSYRGMWWVPHNAHGHSPLLLAPDSRQCRQRPDDAAGLRGGCRTSDEKAVGYRWAVDS